MKISFENFGVIKQGEIEQKPLTILCGENNTGKTYAMYAMYSIINPIVFDINVFYDSLSKLLQELAQNKIVTVDISPFLRNHIHQLDIFNTLSVNASLNLIFNSNAIKFQKNSINVTSKINEVIRDIFSKEIRASTPLYILQKPQNSYLLVIKSTNDYGLTEGFANTFINFFISSIFHTNVILFPAERAGLNLFYPELNAYRTNLLHNFNQNNLIISKYPKPIADYIDWLNLIPNYKNQISQLFSSDSTTLQNKILGGNYSFDETNSINFHLNNDKGHLPLHLTSSTVKTYFGLWFYLQHMAQEGDVLMIDEPELSLHPKNQRNIARLFAQLVNKGIKIVISTHSDYIVREINNLIMLAHAPSEEVKKQLMVKYGYTEDELLTKDKVGAYLFKDNTIENMEISDEGIIATTFDEVISNLNLSSDDIYYSLKDSHE